MLTVPADQHEEPPAMFSVGEDVEADALFKRGWTVSAIARHLERDRKTVRSYLTGERTPGVRRPADTGSSFARQIGANRLAVTLEMAGDGRDGPPPLEQSICFHVFSH